METSGTKQDSATVMRSFNFGSSVQNADTEYIFAQISAGVHPPPRRAEVRQERQINSGVSTGGCRLRSMTATTMTSSTPQDCCILSQNLLI